MVGSKFKIKTDHNNLKYFLVQKELNERQQKWASKVQAYDFEIEYVKGKNNTVADAFIQTTHFIIFHEYIHRLEVSSLSRVLQK